MHTHTHTYIHSVGCRFFEDALAPQERSYLDSAVPSERYRGPRCSHIHSLHFYFLFLFTFPYKTFSLCFSYFSSPHFHYFFHQLFVIFAVLSFSVFNFLSHSFRTLTLQIFILSFFSPIFLSFPFFT